jgi:hypothetical protein
LSASASTRSKAQNTADATVNGKQYLAITSGPSTAAKAKLVNTPELKDQRNATVLYVFAL